MSTTAGIHSSRTEGVHIQKLRAQVESLRAFIATLPSSTLTERWTDFLVDASDAYFFTAFSELTTVQALTKNGWSCQGLSADQKSIRVLDPQGVEYNLLCLSILSSQDLQNEKEQKDQLVQSLNMLESPYQLGVIVRAPLPNNVHWNDLCTGLGKWLYLPSTGVSSFAYMRKADPNLWLEFGVVVEKSPQDPNVLFVMKPFQSPIEWKKIHTQFQHYISNFTSDVPTIVSIVSNHRTSITENHLLSLLYGPLASMIGSAESREYTFDDTLIPGLFKENTASNVQGVMRFHPTTDETFVSESFLNQSTQSTHYPRPYFSASTEEGVFQWCKQP